MYIFLMNVTNTFLCIMKRGVGMSNSIKIPLFYKVLLYTFINNLMWVSDQVLSVF